MLFGVSGTKQSGKGELPERRRHSRAKPGSCAEPHQVCREGQPETRNHQDRQACYIEAAVQGVPITDHLPPMGIRSLDQNSPATSWPGLSASLPTPPNQQEERRTREKAGW